MTFAVGVVVVAAVAAAAAPPTGREIIDGAQEKHGFSTWRTRTLEGSLQTWDGDTLTRERGIEVSERTDPHGEHRTLLEFNSPTDVAGSLFLHLSPRGSRDQQWLWTPQARRARRIAEAAQDEAFFGTDLSYRDLELIVRIQQWTDEDATATRDGEESLDGVLCHVVTLTPRNDEFPYSRYRLWFGTVDPLLLRVDIHGDGGAVTKRVTFAKYEPSAGYSTSMESTVANVGHDTRTIIRVSTVRYDVELDDDLFTVSTLARGR